MKNFSKNLNINSFFKTNNKFSFNKFQKKNLETLGTHYYQGGSMGNQTGIKVCIFGANSGIGPDIASKLSITGTYVNCVHRNAIDTEIPWGEIKLFKNSNPYYHNTNFAANFSVINDKLYKLRAWSDVGQRFFTYCPDLTNDWEIENAIKDCDIIINCIGNNPVIRNMEDFEEANVIIPRKIAKICARLKNDPVKRLIHFSANGVDPDSHSKTLKTKWLGEMEVREHFPEATIIRPTEILHSKPIRNFMG